MSTSAGHLDDTDYRRLLQLRSGLRHFLHWSEEQARATGLTPAQHQLLLAIRGHPDPRGPSIGEAAEYLALRHHSAVGLIDRAELAGLVIRRPDAARPGTVRLSLTADGAEHLVALAHAHITELARLAPSMQAIWDTFDDSGTSSEST